MALSPQPIGQTPPPPPTPRGDAAEAARLVESNRRSGSLDSDALAAGLLQSSAGRSDGGVSLRAAVDAQLTPVQRGQLQSAVDTQLRAQAAPTGGPDRGSVAMDLTQIALDITGIFDPTPISDGSNALISLGRGDFLGAGISALGIIPVLGDAAKLGKLGKWAESVANAAELAVRDPGFRNLVAPTLEKIRDVIRAAPLDSLPASAKAQLEGMARKIDEALIPPGSVVRTGPYEATVRGQRVTLDNIELRSVDYLKRDRASYASLRTEFDRGVRADFARNLATDPANVTALRQAGLNDAQIARLAEGKIPQGYQVHHKLPLDDGGTNDFSNLVLIRNDPMHIGLTNAQRSLVGDLAVGESRRVDFPVPPGVVYPAVP